MTTQTRPMRKRIFQLLEPRATAKLSDKVVDLFLMALIVGNVAAACVESTPYFSDRYFREFHVFEMISVCIFTVEYLLRIWSAMEFPDSQARGPIKGRIRFMLTPLLITDLVVILPFYLGHMGLGLDLRFLRIIRLRRGFRLTRYSSGIQLLNDVLQQERRYLGAIAFLAFLAMIAASSALYIAENHAQPEVFSSIPATLWWAANTLTTLGQSGTVPVTPIGQLCAGTMSFVGVILIGLTAGVMASGFSASAKRRRGQYQRALMERMYKGQSPEEAAKELEERALELILCPVVVDEILDEARHQYRAWHHGCPLCGQSNPENPKKTS